MIDLGFRITGVRAERHAAAPTLMFGLEIREAGNRAIHAILLRFQLQIEPRRRGHGAAEHARLADLFGAPEQWNDSMRPLMWSQASVNVPPFEGSIKIDIPVACTYDFEVASAKYLAALEGGEIPLRMLFSGTVFVKSESGFLVQQVPWNKEAMCRMPVTVWREAMDANFPGCGWIRLRRETLELLQEFRAQNRLTSWEEAIESLMGAGAVK